jgi:four helix bundle protein
MKNNIIKDKSFLLAIEIVRTYELLQNRVEFIMSKQLLKSGTSIEAQIYRKHFQGKYS